MNDLIERLRSEAEISDRPGQYDRLNALADEFADALEAAREDAERYRWLRENCVEWAEDTDEPQLVHRDGGLWRTDWRERLDAAIDQARGKGGKEDSND